MRPAGRAFDGWQLPKEGGALSQTELACPALPCPVLPAAGLSPRSLPGYSLPDAVLFRGAYSLSITRLV